MKHLHTYGAAVWILGCCPLIQAQDFANVQELEAAVAEASNSTDADAKRSMEDQLLASLAKAESREEKSLLCRLLRRIGSSRSVSALSALLADEESSHMARFALASIPGDESLAVMRKALPKVSEKLQIGIMTSLAQRQDLKALPFLEEQLSTPRTTTAIRCLGLLGTKEAVSVLKNHRVSKEAIGFFSEIDEALLTAAESLLKSGNREVPREIYVGVYGAGNKLAALQGLERINDLHAKKFVEDALADDDVTVQRTALRSMMVMAGEDGVSVISQMLPDLPNAVQEIAIDWLGEQGDAFARKDITPFLESNHRVAAIRAMGGLGDTSVVSPLVDRLDHQDQDVRNAARESVIRLQGEEVDTALIGALKSGKSDAVGMVNLLAARGARSALPVLRETSRESTGDLRKAAIKALGNLSTAEELPDLVSLLSDPAMKGESKAVESAILGAFREISKPEDRAVPLLASYLEASDEVKPALINLLGRAGSNASLIVVREALASSQFAISNAAVHTLARWPSKDAIADLYQLAQTAVDPGHRVVALRGYVNMAKGLEDAPAHYEKAIALAKSPEDKKLILSGMGQTDSLSALKLCQGFLGDNTVATEAALACIQISRRSWRQSTDDVEKLMKFLLNHEDETVRGGAKKVIEIMVR
ncbi:MAG: HEAT repeat protein [Verrucomicrobiales bacterium]|jgi:HEAT repeat protein